MNAPLSSPSPSAPLPHGFHGGGLFPQSLAGRAPGEAVPPGAWGGGSRRDFLKSALGVAGALGVPAAFGALRESTPASSETLVATLYQSLTEEQRRAVCFPFDHPLRSRVDNNWQVTEKSVASFFNRDQQQMIREIFLGLHAPEYAQRVLKQVEHDSGAEGFAGGSSIALFGSPGTGKFEFVLTGRHCTRRCDGDSVEGAAFGGPIFYGHAAEGFSEGPEHRGNLYWYQAKRANEVFQMLDGKQREVALLGTGRPEAGTDTVRLTGKKTGLPGLRVGDLSPDQREGVRKVLADLLAPFRRRDAEEALRLIEGPDGAGLEALHLAFYKNQDVGNDGVWDVWQLEGPSMVWHFRGKPHVHVWVNVRASA
jgi:hypothetical protein